MSIEKLVIKCSKAVCGGDMARRIPVLCAVGLVSLSLGPSPAGAAAPELEMLGGSLTVHAVEGKDLAPATLPVLNTGGMPVPVHIEFQAASSGSAPYELAPPTVVAQGQATNVKLTFTGLRSLRKALTGLVVISGGAKPVAQPVTVIPAIRPPNDWVTLIVGVSFGIALILIATVAVEVGASANRGEHWKRLLQRAPPPKLSYASWASHVTVFGALLTTVLASSTLPEVPEQIDKSSLVRLSLLFGGLIVVAPFIFEAIQSPAANRLAKNKVTPEAEAEGGSGLILVLIVSCGLTVAAVVGQIATIGLATWEIVGAHNTLRIAIEVALGLMAALAFYYVLLEASKAALTDWKKEAAKRKAKSLPSASWPLP